MADGSLLCLFDFGERDAERGIEEDRVVSEAMDATRLPCDLPAHGPVRLEYHFPVVRQRDVADESGGARRQATFVQELVDPAELDGVIRAVPARGVDARLVAERVDLEPGVIGHARKAGGRRVVQRLQPGVFGERRARLLRFVYARELGE